MLFLHNLDEQPCTVRLADQLDRIDTPIESFADRDYGPLDPALSELRVEGFGYRWIRVRYTPAG
jgi:maltose alpha-D-glucosyltransferase / alpha-amylase